MKVRIKRKIFIASDNEFSLEKMSSVLMAGGHKVKCAKDVVEVIMKLKDVTLDFDLLILDLALPQIGGLAVLEWMSDCGRAGNPPVLVVGDNIHASRTVKTLKNFGAAGLIVKGATSEHFLYRVNRILCGKKESPRLSARIPITIPVNLTSEKRAHTGEICNVSETGVFIHSYENFKPEDKVSLKFLLPGREGDIKAEGKVVWVNNDMEKDSFYKGAGIYFTGTSPKDKALIASLVGKEKKEDRIW
jgi:uncharacterized protein (TIGR02266 family)